MTIESVPFKTPNHFGGCMVSEDEGGERDSEEPVVEPSLA